MNSDTDPHEIGPDSERTDPDAPTPMRQLLDELAHTRHAAETAADAALDCQVRLSRLERVRLHVPWAALAMSAAALLLAAVACAAVVR